MAELARHSSTAGRQSEPYRPGAEVSGRQPDLSGVWTINARPYGGNIANDLKPGDVLPWAEALTKERQENLGKDNPSDIHCLPFGPRLNFFGPNLLKIVQTPTLIVILSEDLTYRQIFLDGRDLPVDPNPDFMGYSVGHWDGDTLVVATVGYNDRTWLDYAGHPHTESLRTTERLHRRDFGDLELIETFDDPKAYARPWTVKVTGAMLNWGGPGFEKVVGVTTWQWSSSTGLLDGPRTEHPWNAGPAKLDLAPTRSRPNRYSHGYCNLVVPP